MKSFIQNGNTLTVVASAAVLSGDLIVVGSLVGVAATDAAIGENFEVVTEGVFELPKVAVDVVAVGDALYDNGSGVITTTVGTNKYVGYATTAQANGDTTVQVKLSHI